MTHEECAAGDYGGDYIRSGIASKESHGRGKRAGKPHGERAGDAGAGSFFENPTEIRAERAWGPTPRGSLSIAPNLLGLLTGSPAPSRGCLPAPQEAGSTMPRPPGRGRGRRVHCVHRCVHRSGMPCFPRAFRGSAADCKSESSVRLRPEPLLLKPLRCADNSGLRRGFLFSVALGAVWSAGRPARV